MGGLGCAGGVGAPGFAGVWAGAAWGGGQEEGMRGIVGWGRAGGVCSVCSCSVQCLRSQRQGWGEGGGAQPLSQILGAGGLAGVLTHLLSQPIKSIRSD